MKNTTLLPILFATVLPLGAAEISHEFESSYSASTGAYTNLNGRRNGDVSEQNTRIQYVLSYAVPQRPIVRLGVAYERYDFGLTHPAFIPSTIQSANFVAGVDLQISDFLIRLETQPGFYGDFREMGTRDFNFPVVLGVAWVVSKDFQWILGLSYDGNREWPVMGGVGFRWNIDDRWLLNIAPPNPRIEYKFNDDVTLFAGARLAYTTYRTNSQFGTSKSVQARECRGNSPRPEPWTWNLATWRIETSTFTA